MVGILLFVVLRMEYWRGIDEKPFSDMMDYYSISQQVMNQFSFQKSTFWQTYKPPMLPLVGAGVFSLAGKDNFFAYRLFLLAFNLGALLWLAWEVRKLFQNDWVPIVMVWLVALSQPSIFWSYKFSTETLAEGLNYLGAACVLWALRSPIRVPWPYMLAGAILMASSLNRPQMLASTGLIGVFLFIFHCVNRDKNAGDFSKRFAVAVKVALVYGVGALIVWSPWLIRSYNLYGTVVPMTTQSPYSFLFDLGEITVQTDQNTALTTSINQLQREAVQQYENDYEAHKHAKKIARLWLEQNWDTYKKLLGDRFVRITTVNEISLTKVSRHDLFSNRLNTLLLDKTTRVLKWAAVGWLLSIVVFPRLVGMVVITYASLLVTCLFIGYPRILEPYIPLNYIGILFGLYSLVEISRKEMVRKRIEARWRWGLLKIKNHSGP